MGDVRAEDLAELEAVTRSLRWTPADDLRELLAAREAAAGEEEHHLLPVPEFPGRLGSGGVRWRCRYGCGWSHTERPGREAPGPLVLPVGFGPDDVSAAVTRQAEEAHRDLLARVEAAFTEHEAAEHQERAESAPGSAG